MDFKKIKLVLEGEPAYRLKQVYKGIFGELIENWAEMTTLPKQLREKLEQQCSLSIKSKIFEAQDKQTAKALVFLEDGNRIETVLMRHGDGRNTVCVSTQVGCPMGCDFCATGKLGLKRNLTSGEIVEQVLLFSRFLKKEKDAVTNVVFMGMGEPMLNYENVMEAVRILNNKDGFNIGARKISISTCGIVEGINKLSNEPLQINLAISLHAPNNELRSQIMPVNKTYDIDKLFEALKNYTGKTKNRITIEYILLAGINDSEKEAFELSRLLLKKLGKLFMVNLIPYNETGKYKAPTKEAINAFKNELRLNGVEVSQRYRFGHDIEGACGQLAAKDL